MDTPGRHRRAVELAMWFSAAFAIFSVAVALLSLAGVVGQQGDTFYAVLMAGGGALVFAANWVALRIFA